jgi:hypothetical protein
MGIDGIGKKGPPTAPPPAGPTGGRAAGTTRPFEAGKPQATTASAPVEAPRTALDRLKAGEIDANGYIEAKVKEATSHLGVLPPGRIDEIRTMLRQRMTSDPTLADLLRTAVGHAVPPPADD